MTLPENIVEFFRRSSIPLSLSDLNKPDQPIVLVNDMFCEMTGYRADEVVGRNCRFLQADYDNEEARHDIKAAIAAGEPTQVVLENATRSGEHFRNLLFLQPITDRDGQPSHFLGSQYILRAKDGHDRLEHHIRELNGGLSKIETTGSTTRLNTLDMLSRITATQLRASMAVSRLSA